ncbi:MAG: hypothetical protein LBL36_05300, partial [Clostridiales Family XIII bacterium]|nr:hypothetical protein [Clostridiales Family XIII bacterium]
YCALHVFAHEATFLSKHSVNDSPLNYTPARTHVQEVFAKNIRYHYATFLFITREIFVMTGKVTGS